MPDRHKDKIKHAQQSKEAMQRFRLRKKLGEWVVPKKKSNPSPIIFKAEERKDQLGRPLGRSYKQLLAGSGQKISKWYE